MGRRLLDTVDSTNAEAARMAPHLAGPLWILAGAQTAGRGRRARAWASPRGNFHATLALQPREPADRVALRSFAAALALRDAFVALTDLPQSFALKWPNDVLLNGGKVAGILLESSGAGQGVQHLSIGIGVNLIAAPRSPVDKFDRQILALLRSDARTSVSQIAREVSLSRSAVGERIRQLEQRGIISGYHAQVAPPADAGIMAYLELFYQGGRCENYVERMRSFSEVRRCSGISGETDMLVLVEAPNMARLSEVRAAIEAFPQMQRVKTHIVVQDWPL